jgi:hypothetical protein
LILADAVDALDAVPEPLPDPTSARLRACNAIVNALSLAMSCDRYAAGDESSPYRSRLLLDPTPELMVEVMSRTGQAILGLRRAGKTPQYTAQVMLSVVFSALTVLSTVSVTASYVLASLVQLGAKEGLKHRDDDVGHRCHVASPDTVELLATCCDDPVFVDEFLQEMQIQANIDPQTLDRTLQKYELEKAKATPIDVSDELRLVDDAFASCSAALGASTLLFQANLDLGADASLHSAAVRSPPISPC